MFGSKLKKRVEELEQRVRYLSSQETNNFLRFSECIKKDEIVTCETCGHLFLKENSVKGTNALRTRKERRPNGMTGLYGAYFYEIEVEYIHTPYFCRRCAPKENKKKPDA